MTHAARQDRILAPFLTPPKARNIADQLCRSGTSVGANYRAAARAKSTADFIHKMGTVEEEADEVLFWLELAARSGLIVPARLESQSECRMRNAECGMRNAE